MPSRNEELKDGRAHRIIEKRFSPYARMKNNPRKYIR
jgi:hypothetical protein